jgi:hypothetical protein
MSDDPGLDIVKASAEGAATGLAAPLVNAARAMVSAVLGDTMEALDDYAAVRITIRSEHARQRLIETIALSKRMCDEAGIDPGAVGLKIARPILEHAAVEDDASMHARWAALLANAAAGGQGTKVSASLVQILAELDGSEAHMLEVLATLKPPPILLRDYRKIVTSTYGGNGFLDPRFDVLLDNLERLRLCVVDRPNEDLTTLADDLQGAMDANNEELVVTLPSSFAYVRLTSLGSALLEACAPPATRSVSHEA